MAPNMEVTFYACASKQSHHEVVTEKSVSAVCNRYFCICLTSVTGAKPKEKMEFPAKFPHYALTV